MTSPTAQEILSEATGLPVTVVNEATNIRDKNSPVRVNERIQRKVRLFVEHGWDAQEATKFINHSWPDGYRPRSPVPVPQGAQCKDLDFTPEALKPLARGPGKPAKKMKSKKLYAKQLREYEASKKTPTVQPIRAKTLAQERDEAWERGYFEGLRTVLRLVTNELENNGELP